jgi:hypothetical protein
MDDERLLEAQRLDHEELIAFVADVREAVAKAASLEPNADSETVLGLKESLERLYERSAGLAEDQSAHQAALRRLVDLIVRTLRRAAGADPLAQAELDQAEAARALHVEHLQHPLVADLLAPDSPIAADELVATLLCESSEGLAAALVLFDADQLAQLSLDARALLGACDPDRRLEGPWVRLAQMESGLAALLSGRPRN